MESLRIQMPILEKVPQFVLDTVFNKKEFTTIYQGKEVKDFIHWVECKQVDTSVGKVGGGYLVIYSNGDRHHMYQHPDDVFISGTDELVRNSILYLEIVDRHKAKNMFVDDPNGPSVCTVDPTYLLKK